METENTLNFFITIYDPETDLTIISDEQESKYFSVWEIVLLGSEDSSVFQMRTHAGDEIFIPARIFDRSIRYTTPITPEVRERIEKEKERKERSGYI